MNVAGDSRTKCVTREDTIVLVWAIRLLTLAATGARVRRCSRAMPPVWHPMVRRHPVTGRKSLFISSIYNDMIEGMGEDESRRLIEDLSAFAAQPKYMYRHVWEPHDVLMWDNRCTVHAVTPYDPHERRVMHRIVVESDPFS